MSLSNDTIALSPAGPFHPGELVQATVTRGIENMDGESLAAPFVWQFRTAASGGTGLFSDSGQRLGNGSQAVALGDLDGDHDLDAFVANGYQPNDVWFNDGSGTFIDSGQALGDSSARSVAIGDLDGDGALDAFVGNYGANKVWLNQDRTPGDFDNDLDVDRDDLFVWQAGFGIASGAQLGHGDADGDFDVDGNDFLLWQNHFGMGGETSGPAGMGAGSRARAEPPPSRYSTRVATTPAPLRANVVDRLFAELITPQETRDSAVNLHEFFLMDPLLEGPGNARSSPNAA